MISPLGTVGLHAIVNPSASDQGHGTANLTLQYLMIFGCAGGDAASAYWSMSYSYPLGPSLVPSYREHTVRLATSALLELQNFSDFYACSEASRATQQSSCESAREEVLPCELCRSMWWLGRLCSSRLSHKCEGAGRASHLLAWALLVSRKSHILRVPGEPPQETSLYLLSLWFHRLA